jgi:hypothetical protein
LTAILEGKRACNENGGSASTLIYSGASFSVPANGWGGARNHANRTSNYIKLEAALELVEAAQWAIAAGVPFNRHLTIHWAKCGIPDGMAAAASGRLVKLIGDWVKKGRGRFAYAWVREIGPWKGSHVHILLHLPRHLKLGHMTRKWVRSIASKPPKRGILTKAIGGTTTSAFSGSDWYEANLAAVVSYLLKGVDHVSGEALGLDEYALGGRIIGKRVSVSQNIGRARRGRANPCNLKTGQQGESSVKTLTANFSCAFHARARAKPEPENQNFADDLGKSGEVA